MNYLTIQYLEDSPDLPGLAVEAVRQRMRDAAARLPVTHFLVGWNLPPALLQACQEESARLGAAIYRWHPFLASDGSYSPIPEWQTVGPGGDTIPGFHHLPEFTFLCPNNPQVEAAVLDRLESLAHSGQYQGIFLDRIRFPSPSPAPLHHLGCFCVHCQRAARAQGLDLDQVSAALHAMVRSPLGCMTLVRSLLNLPASTSVPGNNTRNLPRVFQPRTNTSGVFQPRTSTSGVFQPQTLDDSPHGRLLQDFLAFRCTSITRLAHKAAALVHAAGLEVGLDCFSPGLTGMVGQDLPALGARVDWIKAMSYAHTLGPAGLPFELLGLADWLVHTAALKDKEAMQCLADALDLPLPLQRKTLREKGLSPSALQAEIRRGCLSTPTPVLAGLELVELAGVTNLDVAQIRADHQAVRAAAPAGLALSWDLRLMSNELLDLVSSLWSESPNR